MTSPLKVGITGFFIDIAVKRPLKPGTFLLAIECDGASYHSGERGKIKYLDPSF
jgi:hypothetical protein